MCEGKFSGNFSTPRVVSEFVSGWTDVSNRRQKAITWKIWKGKTAKRERGNSLKCMRITMN